MGKAMSLKEQKVTPSLTFLEYIIDRKELSSYLITSDHASGSLSTPVSSQNPTSSTQPGNSRRKLSAQTELHHSRLSLKALMIV